MPIRVYEIAKKLGIENKDVLAKAKELGIAAKVASSSLDRITAEYLEEKLGGVKISDLSTSAPIKIISKPFAAPDSTPQKTSFVLLPKQPAQQTLNKKVEKSTVLHFAREVNRKPELQNVNAQFSEKNVSELIPPVAGTTIVVKSPIVVEDLADQLKRRPFQLIADLMGLGCFASVNQSIDATLAQKICEKYGCNLSLLIPSQKFSEIHDDLKRLEERNKQLEGEKAITGRKNVELTDKQPKSELGRESDGQAPDANSMLIVDGLNIMNWAQNPSTHRINLQILLTVLVALKKQGHDFICILDAKTHPVLKRFRPDQVTVFEMLLKSLPDHFAVITGGAEADYFILSQAEALNCGVLSNDKFTDYQPKFSWVGDTSRRPTKNGRKSPIEDSRLVHGGVIANQVSVPQLGINAPIANDAEKTSQELINLLKK